MTLFFRRIVLLQLAALFSLGAAFQPRTKLPHALSRPSTTTALLADVTTPSTIVPEEFFRSASSSDASKSHGSSGGTGTRRVAVLVCPAQFCVPDDYKVLFDNLSAEFAKNKNTGGDKNKIELATCLVAPLPRTEWIKVAKKLPSAEFLEARLPVHETLNWYFQAMETALAEIFAKEGPEINICIIGHSIGGWVARAYLGGLSRSSTAVFPMVQSKCSSLITLGTPHSSPDSALVDQTRGLLREIAEAESCSPRTLMEDFGIDITCVGSSSVSGDLFSGRGSSSSSSSSLAENVVALSSYFPLLGRVGPNVVGDGIVPLELAFMDAPARRVEVSQCDLTGAPVRHSHILPTPWNLWNGYAPSIVLPKEFTSYVSQGVLSQWAKYIR